MAGYLIYHPRRVVTRFAGLTVYHDHTEGNQDPYVWNEQFLHTFCHITQMRPAPGDINFWVGGDTFPDFDHLYCDLVFVVGAKLYWSSSNSITPRDPLVDSREACDDHYRWAGLQHPLKRRRRFTLKADPHKSFQPRAPGGTLIDIVPGLLGIGYSLEELREGLRAGFVSRPMALGERAAALYDWLHAAAPVKLRGATLREVRRALPDLASPGGEARCC